MDGSNSPESTADRGFPPAPLEPPPTQMAIPPHRGTIDSAKDSITQELRGARDDVQRRAADTVNRQKHEVADRLESVVHALGAAQQSLRDDDQAQLAGYVGDVSRQIQRSTGYLRNNDYSGMMRDMNDLARRNSGVFVGSTFIAGLAVGRLLRASEPEEPMDGTQTDMSTRDMTQRDTIERDPIEREWGARREEP